MLVVMSSDARCDLGRRSQWIERAETIRALYTDAVSENAPSTPESTSRSDSNDTESKRDVGSKRRIVCGWIVTALGFIAILWGVFHLTSATIGGPIYQFKDRRTYNEVKKAAHEVYPGALLRALGGLALMWWGGHIRSGAKRDGPDENGEKR
jgi:hypothetical protein